MTFHLNKKAIIGAEFDVLAAPHRPLRLWLWLLVFALVLLVLGMTAAMGQAHPRRAPVPPGVPVVPFGPFLLPDRSRLDPGILVERDPGIDTGLLAERDWRIDPGIFGSRPAPVLLGLRPPMDHAGRVFIVPPQVRRR